MYISGAYASIVPVLSCAFQCAFSDLLLLSAPVFLHCTDLFASYWFLVCKATVSGTALICHYVRPSGSETVGPLQAAVAALRRGTGKRWMGLLHRILTLNTPSTDTGLPL